MGSRSQKTAVDVFENRLADNPQLRIFARLADAYRKNGDIQKAVDLCVQGLQYHPMYVTGRIILGRCYLEQENYSSAINEFIKICEIDRRNHLAIKMLADTYVRQGFSEKAGDLYTILKQIDPFNSTLQQLSSQY